MKIISDTSPAPINAIKYYAQVFKTVIQNSVQFDGVEILPNALY